MAAKPILLQGLTLPYKEHQTHCRTPIVSCYPGVSYAQLSIEHRRASADAMTCNLHRQPFHLLPRSSTQPERLL